MSTEPRLIPNEEFATGGIYPGGKLKILEFRYTLWDYEGKQPPDSVLAVLCRGLPTDGSNEGKEVTIYWSIGPASEFMPDHNGGNILGVGTREKTSDNSNWKQVYDCFLKAGLEKGKISGPQGIRVFEGSEITFARVPQKVRDFQDQGTTEGGPKKREILVPTYARFVWEGNKGQPAAAQARPAAAQTVTAPASAPASTQAPANGAANGAVSLSSVLSSAIARHGSVSIEALGKILLDEMAGVDRPLRMSIVKESKDTSALEELAIVNNWKFDGNTISA